MLTCIMRREKECDLVDFNRGMVVGAGQASLSIFLEPADLQGFSHTALCTVYTQ